LTTYCFWGRTIKDLTLGDRAEIKQLTEREPELLEFHRLYVSNFFEVEKTNIQLDIQFAREEVEKIEKLLSRLNQLRQY